MMQNQTTVTSFILLGLTDDIPLKILLFIFLFLSYMLSLSGNLSIITLTLIDSHHQYLPCLSLRPGGKMPSYSLGSHLLPATESGPSHCWLLQERWRTSHLYRCIYTFRYTKLHSRAEIPALEAKSWGSEL